jgi:hypothetical protein
MRFETVFSFLFQIFEQAEPSRANFLHLRVTGENMPGYTEPVPGRSGPATVEKITPDKWAAQCNPEEQIGCVIGVLYGTDEDDVEVIRDLAESFDAAPLNFLYIDAGCHMDFAASFDLDVPMLPTVVIYNPLKGR